MHHVQPNPDTMANGKAFPIITDGEMQRLGVDGKMEQAVMSLGMACNVGQGFLRDAVGSYLHGGGQGRQG